MHLKQQNMLYYTAPPFKWRDHRSLPFSRKHTGFTHICRCLNEIGNNPSEIWRKHYIISHIVLICLSFPEKNLRLITYFKLTCRLLYVIGKKPSKK
jgi:hypothetical protein